MSFPRYPEYKDSGVEWLGEVPEPWKVVPVKTVSTCNDEVLPESTEPDYEIEYVEISDVSAGLGIISSSLMPFAAAPSRARRIVRHGDVIVSTVRTYLKAIASIHAPPDNMLVSTGFAVIRPHAIDARFAGYLFQSHFLIDEVIARSVGVSYPAINASELMRLKIPVPGATEQSVIAAILDRETAKIDALVAEQQNLIALLKEKRQALISHAVTKGLDPDVPMKDSGVPWLGEVPAHWDLMPLKRELVFLTSGSRGWASNYSDEGALFIRIGNLTRDTIGLDLSDIQRVVVPAGAEGERTRLRSGDLLFSITAFLGSVAVVPAGLEPAYVSQHVALARLSEERLLPEWVAFVTLSDVGKTYLASQGYGGTKIQLSLDDVANLTMLVPPKHEQAKTLSFMKAELQRLDTLTTEAELSIALLQERRTALISAAVTGKIDVRHLAAASTEPTPEPA